MKDNGKVYWMELVDPLDGQVMRVTSTSEPPCSTDGELVWVNEDGVCIGKVPHVPMGFEVVRKMSW